MIQSFAFDYHCTPESTELAEEIFNTPKEEYQGALYNVTSILLERVKEGSFRLVVDSKLVRAEHKALYENEYAWLLDRLERELQGTAFFPVLDAMPDPSSL